jgi:tight adherence protein C
LTEHAKKQRREPVVVELVVLGVVWLLGLVLIYGLWQRLRLHEQGRQRVFEDSGRPAWGLEDDQGPLTRWLFRAGFRRPGAATTFLTLTLAGFCMGGVVTIAILLSDQVHRGVHILTDFPGGVGELFIPLVYVAPWTPLFVCTCLPWLFVRAARRRRVAQLEEDLPLTLELLATLAEAGLGFDAGLERVLAALAPTQPLAQELRAFQAEVLAGRGRIASLRRLSQRIDVLPFSVFISALVQAEQTGGGVTDVLRRQAEDLRSRRRDEATAFAMALPVKLLFPLVICFLPGLFVVTLGPTFNQFIQAIDAVMNQGRLRP